jgi:hypothetical protein
MKKTKKSYLKLCTIALAMVLFLPMQGFAQELKPGEVLPELTAEQKMNRLTGMLNSMVLVALNYAEMHGESIEEAGSYFGKVFANGWPEVATPEYYVAAMNRNWKLWDMQAEVLEVGDDYVKVRRDRLQFSDQLEGAYQEMYGYGVSDIEIFFRHLQKEIASELGLELTYRDEDEHVVYTVSVSK